MVSATVGAMNALLGKLATLMGEEFTNLSNVRKEVKFISDELTSMKDALEGLSYVDELDPQTKRWRDIVREMSYDIEDIIDDFMHAPDWGEKRKTSVCSQDGSTTQKTESTLSDCQTNQGDQGTCA
jgi:predicted methyltransferase